MASEPLTALWCDGTSLRKASLESEWREDVRSSRDPAALRPGKAPEQALHQFKHDKWLARISQEQTRDQGK